MDTDKTFFPTEEEEGIFQTVYQNKDCPLTNWTAYKDYSSQLEDSTYYSRDEQNQTEWCKNKTVRYGSWQMSFSKL